MSASRRVLALLLLAASVPGAQAQPAQAPAQAQAQAQVQPAQVQPAQAQPAQAGRDLAREDANRRLVLEFYEGVFVRKDLSVAERLLTEGYIQHNPRVPNGRAAFIAVFGRIFAANPGSRSRLLRSATDGDLVFIHHLAQSTPEERGRVIVDIFRVENGRIAEHWDVIQDVPETTVSGNTVY
jgi:predicted SnoaL-like aldol condensation-catalyzing enzyme